MQNGMLTIKYHGNSDLVTEQKTGTIPGVPFRLSILLNFLDVLLKCKCLTVS